MAGAVPDPYEVLRRSLNPDGTLDRSSFLALFPPAGEPRSAAEVAVTVQTFPLNPSHGTRLWVFFPGDGDNHPATTLPVLLYVHGGGFVAFNADSGPFLSTCRRLSGEIPAVVVAVEHRLAPEHRLPAAYEDVAEALHWLRSQATAVSDDTWRRRRVDFSRLFLAGSSSGGNIVFHVAQRLMTQDSGNIRPLEIRGIVLNEPFFGGAARTQSEAASEHDKALPLPFSDLLWELALPEGADRDHVFCNPFLRGPREGWQSRQGTPLLPRCLLRCYVGDPLIDRLRAMAEILEKEAAGIVAKMEDDGVHCADFFDSSKFDCFIADVRNFVSSSP